MVTCLLLSKKFKAVFSWSKQAIFSRIKDENVFVYLNDTNVLSPEFKIFDVIPKLKIDRTKIHKIKFSDYFEKVAFKPIIDSKLENKPGIYLYVTSTSLNNGVKFCSDFWNIKASEFNPIISINNDGSAGYTFIQTRDFSANNHVKLFKPKNNELNLIITCLLLTNQFKKIKYLYNQPTLSILTHDFNYDVFVYFN